MSVDLTMAKIEFDRFVTKFKMGDGCWEWTAGLDKDGYGRFQLRGYRLAHRIAYTEFVGPIPDGMVMDHLCRNRSCVRPGHLEPVTYQENTIRGLSPETARRRWLSKTHCPQGHEYSVENTYRNAQGFRICKLCKCHRDRIAYHLRRKTR